jgi:hypothetical protein
MAYQGFLGGRCSGLTGSGRFGGACGFGGDCFSSCSFGFGGICLISNCTFLMLVSSTSESTISANQVMTRHTNILLMVIASVVVVV